MQWTNSKGNDEGRTGKARSIKNHCPNRLPGLFAEMGYAVQFVSVTNGDVGHQ